MRLFEIRGSFPDGQSLTLGDYMLCAGHTNMVVLVGSGVADSLNRVHRDIPVHLTEREPAYFASLVTDEWNPDPFVKRHLPGIDGSLVYAGDHGLTPTILDSLHGAWSNNGHHQPIDQGTFIETIGRHGRGTFTIVSSSAPPDLAIGFVNGPADDKDFLRAMR
jgi:hypothetical protein